LPEDSPASTEWTIDVAAIAFDPGFDSSALVKAVQSRATIAETGRIGQRQARETNARLRRFILFGVSIARDPMPQR
jgi:hypothetical protein